MEASNSTIGLIYDILVETTSPPKVVQIKDRAKHEEMNNCECLDEMHFYVFTNLSRQTLYTLLPKLDYINI